MNARSTTGAPKVRLPKTLDNLPQPEPVKPENPARAAARLLLARALAAAGATLEEATRDGAVCVVRVPAPEWIGPTRDTWAAWARRREPYVDGQENSYLREACWVAWAPAEEPKKHQRERGMETFADAVAEGRHCAGFSPDLAWLPADLVQAADLRFDLPPLTGTDVAALAFSLCGGLAQELLTDGDAAALTPRLLRLARRPGQTADDYVRKLRNLVARERAVRSAAMVAASPRDAPGLDRLHGMDEAVAWGMRLARDLAAYRAGQLAWAQVDGRGCLLSGPPGCGKTLFARALAATCGVPLVNGSYGQWHASGSAHQGDFLKAMLGAFAAAKEKARTDGAAILFIDEVDSFPNREALTHHYRSYETQVVNALLAEIDGAEGRTGVVLIAACNHPHLLDPALVRSGRLDRHIRVRLPGVAALAGILREHLGEDLAGDFLQAAALAAAGATGADCERFVRGARRRAREATRAVDLTDLLAEINGEPGADHRSAELRRIVAIHESGHAVLAALDEPGALVRVTIHPNAGVSGATTGRTSGAEAMTRDKIDAALRRMLAGRAAEQALLGQVSAGAGGGPESDLAQATLLATSTEITFGMGGAGLLWTGMPRAEDLQTVLTLRPELARRVATRLEEAHAAALEAVERHRGAVKRVAATLLERGSLTGDEVAALVAGEALPGFGRDGDLAADSATRRVAETPPSPPSESRNPEMGSAEGGVSVDTHETDAATKWATSHVDAWAALNRLWRPFGPECGVAHDQAVRDAHAAVARLHDQVEAEAARAGRPLARPQPADDASEAPVEEEAEQGSRFLVGPRPPQSERGMTFEDFLAWQADEPDTYELVDGFPVRVSGEKQGGRRIWGAFGAAELALGRDGGMNWLRAPWSAFEGKRPFLLAGESWQGLVTVIEVLRRLAATADRTTGTDEPLFARPPESLEGLLEQAQRMAAIERGRAAPGSGTT